MIQTNYSSRGQLLHVIMSLQQLPYQVTKEQIYWRFQVELPNGKLDRFRRTTEPGSTDIAAGQYVYDIEIFTR